MESSSETPTNSLVKQLGENRSEKFKSIQFSMEVLMTASAVYSVSFHFVVDGRAVETNPQATLTHLVGALSVFSFICTKALLPPLHFIRVASKPINPSSIGT